MTASFFWANGGQGKDPLEAIKLRDNEWAKTRLQKLWVYPPASFALPRRDALIMSGVTDDLQRALQSGIDEGGMKEILVEGLMAIWYVRCKHYLKEITVVSIASLQGYWDLKLNDPDNSSGYKWLRLYTGYTVNGGISLDALANQLLPRAKGVDSWKLDRAEVTAEEGFLRSLTPPALAMSPIPSPNPNNPVWLVGDIPVLFNDAAKQATIDKANQFITDPNFPLREQDGFPTVVGQFMKDVGRSEIRVGGDRARGTLLKATGGEDPRVTLRQFARSDAGALNLSRFLNQDVILAITGNGWKAAVPPNANGKQLVPRFPAGKTRPGNTKTQFITVQVEDRGFVIDYEVDTPLSGFRTDMDKIDLDEDKSWLKASMQIFVGAGALAAANFTSYSYTFTKPPEVALHTEMTMASLDQQAG
jgi:hypothetical protein